MRRPTKRAAMLLLALPFSSILVACGGGSSNTVLIAVEGPMSGDQASTGQDMFRGAELAVSQMTGKVAGKKVKLVAADDAADADKGVTVAHQMVDKHVVAVVGPFNSSVGV